MIPLVITVGFLVAAVLIISLICYRMAFYVPPRKTGQTQAMELPHGKIYEPYWEKMANWTRQTRQMPCEKLCITSVDGLELHGKYYEYAPGAPIELMFHGYRGTAERDLSGGVQRCFRLGHSALIVDQRCCGKSQGRTITFGVYEHLDCIKWIELAVEKFGPEVKLLLTGISMGAATVLMAAGKPLPPNVVGVLADCGYSTPRDIIRKVIRDRKLPVAVSYPFVRLGGLIYGGFDVERYSALEAMKTCTLPVLLFHGENDDFVPCQMSRQIYEACSSKKRLVTVHGAGHGMCCLLDPDGYVAAMEEFFSPELQ